MNKSRNFILLGIGVVITLLFIILSEKIFEAVYYQGSFSDTMHNNSAYTKIAGIIFVMTWGGAALYYYIINSVRFDRWYHWLATGAATTLLTAVAGYFATKGFLPEYEDHGEIFGFTIYVLLFAAVMFIIASFSIRWWSSNCRHTPIPQ